MNSLSWISGLATGGFVIVSATLGVILVDYSDSQRELRDLDREIETLYEDLDARDDTIKSLETDAVDQTQTIQALQAQLEEASNQEPQSTHLKPFSARAYLGDTFVGEARVGYRHEVIGEGEEQKTIYHPIVKLDESMRPRVTLYETNVVNSVVQQPTPVNQTANYNYYPNNNPWSVWFVPVATNGGGQNPTTPTQPQAPTFKPSRLPQPGTPPRPQNLLIKANPSGPTLTVPNRVQP